MGCSSKLVLRVKSAIPSSVHRPPVPRRRPAARCRRSSRWVAHWSYSPRCVAHSPASACRAARLSTSARSAACSLANHVCSPRSLLTRIYSPCRLLHTTRSGRLPSPRHLLATGLSWTRAAEQSKKRREREEGEGRSECHVGPFTMGKMDYSQHVLMFLELYDLPNMYISSKFFWN